MSNQIDKRPEKRKYRKKRRAEQERETRRRIAAALVELHGSVGPAGTTVSEVAQRAGVQRATVYRHFPDEAAMFAACSAHWAERNPLPDPAGWAAIADPDLRLRAGLAALYDFYAANEAILDNTTRDEPRVPALRPSMEAFRGYLQQAGQVLAGDRASAGAGPGGGRLARAAIGHAVSFSTWRSLVREQGLDRDEAIELMVSSARGTRARR